MPYDRQGGLHALRIIEYTTGRHGAVKKQTAMPAAHAPAIWTLSGLVLVACGGGGGGGGGGDIAVTPPPTTIIPPVTKLPPVVPPVTIQPPTPPTQAGQIDPEMHVEVHAPIDEIVSARSSAFAASASVAGAQQRQPGHVATITITDEDTGHHLYEDIHLAVQNAAHGHRYGFRKLRADENEAVFEMYSLTPEYDIHGHEFNDAGDRVVSVMLELTDPQHGGIVIEEIDYHVRDVNEAPDISVPNTVAIRQGESKQITEHMLAVIDPDIGDNDHDNLTLGADTPSTAMAEAMTFTVHHAVNGDAMRDGVVLDDKDTFTLTELRAGRIYFRLADGITDEANLAVSVADDGDGNDIQKSPVRPLHFSVTDNAPPTIAIATAGLAAEENAAAQLIARVSITADPEGIDDYTARHISVAAAQGSYAIRATGDAGVFDILASGLDFEHNAVNDSGQMGITIRITDPKPQKNSADPLIVSRDAVIAITDINEPPLLTISEKAAVDENTGAFSRLATLTMGDDAPAEYRNTHFRATAAQGAFEIRDAEGAGVFALYGRGFDFETAAGGALNVLITVTDARDDSISIPVSTAITINNVNEAPTITASGGAGTGNARAIAIAENDAGTIAGFTFTAQDPDTGAITAPSALAITGDHADRFRILRDGDVFRLAHDAFDHETHAATTLAITHTDPDGLAARLDLTITIGNVNDAPHDIALAGGFLGVGRNDAGRLTAADTDDSSGFTYTIIADDDARAIDGAATHSAYFSVSGDALTFTGTAANRLAAGERYRVRIAAEDDDGAHYIEIVEVAQLGTYIDPGTRAVIASYGPLLITAAEAGPDSNRMTARFEDDPPAQYLPQPGYSNIYLPRPFPYHIVIEVNPAAASDRMAGPSLGNLIREITGSERHVLEQVVASIDTEYYPDARFDYRMLANEDSIRPTPLQTGSDALTGVKHFSGYAGGLLHEEASRYEGTEDEHVHYFVGSLGEAVADASANRSAAFALAAGNSAAGYDNDKFAIRKSTGDGIYRLYMTEHGDRGDAEENGIGDTFTILLDVTITDSADGTTHTTRSEYEIRLIDTNEYAPVFNAPVIPAATLAADTGRAAAITEGTGYFELAGLEDLIDIALPILQVSAADSDRDAVLRYGLPSGEEDNDAFTIDPESGAIRFIAAPDFDIKPVYDIRVEAFDGLYNPFQSIKITLDDVVSGGPLTESDTDSVVIALAPAISDTDPAPAETRIYSGRALDNGNGLLAENADGTTDAIFIGYIKTQVANPDTTITATALDVSADDFAIIDTAHGIALTYTGSDSGNFEAGETLTVPFVVTYDSASQPHGRGGYTMREDFTLRLADANDAPRYDTGVAINNPHLGYGESVVITKNDLSYIDEDAGATPADVAYTLADALTRYGSIEKSTDGGLTWADTTGFTQDDIDNGRVRYHQDRGDLSKITPPVSLDSFRFLVDDGDPGEGIGGALVIFLDI